MSLIQILIITAAAKQLSLLNAIDRTFFWSHFEPKEMTCRPIVSCSRDVRRLSLSLSRSRTPVDAKSSNAELRRGDRAKAPAFIHPSSATY